jgi:large conductance mechanosensitive channel
MLREFKAFLIKQNILALAIAVVIGTALNTVIKALVDDFIMPVVAVFQPGGNWQTMTWDVGPVKFGVGDFLAALVNFIIIGFVVWRISKALIKPDPEAPTKTCGYCRMSVDATATRCAFCTSELLRA